MNEYFMQDLTINTCYCRALAFKGENPSNVPTNSTIRDEYLKLLFPVLQLGYIGKS